MDITAVLPFIDSKITSVKVMDVVLPCLDLPGLMARVPLWNFSVTLSSTQRAFHLKRRPSPSQCTWLTAGASKAKAYQSMGRLEKASSLVMRGLLTWRRKGLVARG